MALLHISNRPECYGLSTGKLTGVSKRVFKATWCNTPEDLNLQVQNRLHETRSALSKIINILIILTFN